MPEIDDMGEDVARENLHVRYSRYFTIGAYRIGTVCSLRRWRPGSRRPRSRGKAVDYDDYAEIGLLARLLYWNRED